MKIVKIGNYEVPVADVLYETIRTEAIDECRDILISLYGKCENMTEFCANARDLMEQLKEKK